MIFLVLLGGIGYSYWHFVINRDYTLVHHVDCDPAVEVCFYWQCDPQAVEEDEQCTGDPEEDEWYYKHLERLAKNVPECSVNDETCDAFGCAVGEKGCGEVLCNEKEAAIDEVVCSDPAEYRATHPEALEDEEDMKEDASDAEEGDENIEEEDASIVDEVSEVKEMENDASAQEEVIPADEPGSM